VLFADDPADAVTPLMVLRFLGVIAVFAPLLSSQTVANYDEAKVGTYTLPDPLRFLDGRPVRTAREWTDQRRPEIIHLFEENQFGRSPERPADMHFDMTEDWTAAFAGKAYRKQVAIYFAAGRNGPSADVVLYVPARIQKAPVLLNLAFVVNSWTVDDPGLAASAGSDRSRETAQALRNLARVDVNSLLDAGFGFATVNYSNIEPDFDGGMQFGVRARYLLAPGHAPAPNEWGAISAWAWGLSRVFDYLQTESKVDSSRVALFGVSRLGKAVLWAGARDARFAAVVACCSGEGGASISRRDYGETVANLNTNFPYWFCANYAKYSHSVSALPIDSNMLLALIAPRPVLLQTGDKDLWGDPKGEFLAEVGAGPVYRLLGRQDLGTDVWPPAGTPILHTLAYYMHAGGHGPLPDDWAVFRKFLRMQLQESTPRTAGVLRSSRTETQVHSETEQSRR
jgi:hypothetical protein